MDAALFLLLVFQLVFTMVSPRPVPPNLRLISTDPVKNSQIQFLVCLRYSIPVSVISKDG
jgi:hypothetical protein